MNKLAKEKPKPNFWWSMLMLRCPRCRRGRMFNNYSPYNFKHTLDMKNTCPVCGQKMEPEIGFWYGTGYVSYALAVAISVTSFIASVILFRVTFMDNSILWWLGANSFFLIVIQPWLMRFSRSVYIHFFVKYDKDYDRKKGIQDFHH
ncbi:MAG TPA: DUF983 domain-containing protein [Chitinophagaceae bacterium]|nr:DUF983 domain-containing protein [Chitinophagaceae bacterium]